MLYTSGTTGRPKGVVTEHRNVTHFVAAFNDACSTTADDRIFQGFSLGFDGSTEDAVAALLDGDSTRLSNAELDRLSGLIARAKQKRS